MHALLALSCLLQDPETDAAAGRWALLPRPLASFGAAADDGWLYVYGGHLGPAHAHSRERQSAQFLRLNLHERAAWEELPGGAALQSVALVAGGGRIYRLGGMEARNAAGADEDLHSSADCERYDPLQGTWEPLPDLPEPRSSHDAALLEGRLYVAGGWSLEGAAQHWLQTAWMMDLANAELRWQPLPPLPEARRGLDLSAAGGRLWALGGITEDGSVSARVDYFDPAGGGWQRAPDLPEPGFGASAEETPEGLVASGMGGTLWLLAPDAARWERRGELAFPRYFHRLVRVGADEVAAIGGAAAGGYLRSVETFFGDGRPAPPQTWILPSPGAARSRQGVLLHGRELLLFGGNDSMEQHDFAPANFEDAAFALDLANLELRRLPPQPQPRQSLAAVTLEDEATAVAHGAAPAGPADAAALVVGGFGHDGSTARSFGEVWRLDCDTGSWIVEQTGLPRPRSQFGLVRFGGKVWVFGGLDYLRGREPDFQFPLEVLARDPALDAALEDTGARLPRPRRAFGGALLDGRYYLVGGLEDEFTPVEAVDVFDFDTRTWSAAPAPAHARISPQLVAMDGCLYLAGGTSIGADGEFRPDATVERFDPAAQSWTTVLDRLPIAPDHLQALAYRGRLLLYSAYSGEPHVLRLALLEVARH